MMVFARQAKDETLLRQCKTAGSSTDPVVGIGLRRLRNADADDRNGLYAECKPAEVRD
jgi:hypothetical protein